MVKIQLGNDIESYEKKILELEKKKQQLQEKERLKQPIQQQPMQQPIEQNNMPYFREQEQQQEEFDKYISDQGPQEQLPLLQPIQQPQQQYMTEPVLPMHPQSNTDTVSFKQLSKPTKILIVVGVMGFVLTLALFVLASIGVTGGVS